MQYPFLLLKFWYMDAPVGIMAYFLSLNRAFFQLFSTPLLLKTFFKPWKNEYREGLVGFSIGMGMFVKTFVIIASLALFLVLFAFEILFLGGFLLWPIGTVYLLFL